MRSGLRRQAQKRDFLPKFNVCALELKKPGEKSAVAWIHLNAFGDAAEAENWSKLEADASTKIDGLGDRAWPQVKDKPALKSTDYSVGVIKGRMVVAINSVQRAIMLKGEYFLTDTVSVMIEHGAKVRTNEISTWLDTGTIEATLDTNKILLEKQGSIVQTLIGSNVEIIDPVAIGEGAEISDSTLGPYTSIGANCKISNNKITESILEMGCEIKDAVLNRSLIGSKQAKVHARGDGHVIQLNVGDTSEVLV